MTAPTPEPDAPAPLCLSGPPVCDQPARYAIRVLDLVEDIGIDGSPFWPACETHAARARASGQYHLRTLREDEIEVAS